jgi:hypothetical protein
LAHYGGKTRDGSSRDLKQARDHQTPNTEKQTGSYPDKRKSRQWPGLLRALKKNEQAESGATNETQKHRRLRKSVDGVS